MEERAAGCAADHRVPNLHAARGGIANIQRGTPSADDTTILDDAENVLLNYSQDNKLGLDAAQFTSDEQSYNPDHLVR